MVKKNTKAIEKIIEKIFSKMGLKASWETIEEPGFLRINIKSPDSALLIGYRGQTLRALQHLINIIWQNRKETSRIVLDVESYRQKQNQELEEMAERMAQRVLKSKRPEVLPPMTAYERRIIHLALANRKDLTTESVGEEPNRRIIIRLKTKN